MKEKQKSAKSPAATRKRYEGFTDEEREAMKARVQEQKVAEAKADGESALLANIAEMREPDRAMGQRLHAIIKASAPSLSPTTWYGVPASAKDGKGACHFPTAQKVKARY